MGITFIEGLPCAGKSLLIKHLIKEGFDTIHELGRVINPKEFPGNGHSVKEILAIDDWFLDKEKERMSSNKGFFDRSYFTHLTYAYAYSRYMNINSFEKTVEKYNNEILNGRLGLPDNLVYIKLGEMDSISRQETKISLGRRPLDEFWRDNSFLKDLLKAYDTLIDCMTGSKIILLNGENPTEVKYNNIIVGLQETYSNKKSIDLEKYIGDLHG